MGTLADANRLLAAHHYLGPLKSGAKVVIVGWRDGEPVAAMLWKHPTSRHLPSQSWLELSRWCLTAGAGDNAGSRMHKQAARLIQAEYPHVTTLVSYSDPTQGHTGALYRACNWHWAPTWQRLRPPPTGGGDWGGKGRQAPKDRWVFAIRPDPARAEILAAKDNGAIRHWRKSGDPASKKWAKASPYAPSSTEGN